VTRTDTGLHDRARAAAHDLLLRRFERAFAAHRRRLLASARGRVLEIGAGTGFNIPEYPDGLDELVVTDPSPAMLRRARARAVRAGRRVTAIRAPAERLPFGDGEFDTVVSTFVLCSVAHPGDALREIRRMLQPGGALLFCEHVRSDDPRRARWQDRLERPWMVVADGCHPNRATLERIAEAPFDVVCVEHGELPQGARIVRPLVTGRAVAR
jgi:ubiquinone/menaquinone biosynthesis C-methylase UbiE